MLQRSKLFWTLQPSSFPVSELGLSQELSHPSPRVQRTKGLRISLQGFLGCEQASALKMGKDNAVLGPG